MLFNSIGFIIFLPIVFTLYWSFKDSKYKNIILLIASYYFYACWNWKFLFLLIFSTALDYYTGIKISESKEVKSKQFWLTLSILINVGFLGFFKYYNFFVSSFVEAISHIGIHINTWTLKVILPVGISFYTFHGLSYVIDIYRGKVKPVRNFVDYSVFVSFFPLLVAGPIERATHLLPQIQSKRTFNFNNAADGLRQMLWGFFKKIVIADQCASYTTAIFNNQHAYSGSDLLMGALFFSFQIYCDFSGYSDIALGTARLFGLELLRNFAFPYFSRDVAEFWRRWHISLSSWFRDYLYIPLGGSKGSTWNKIRNVLIVFVVSGFWHGANWTFIFWGLLNAIFIMPSIIFKTNRNNLDIVAEDRNFPSLKELISMGITFSLIAFAWIFFRSQNLTDAFGYVSHIFSRSLFTIPTMKPRILITLIFLFLIIEWIGRRQQYALANFELKSPKIFRWTVYYGIVLLIFYFAGSEQPFIYFQF